MNTYGSLSNSELLHQYGFTEPNNPHHEVRKGMGVVISPGLRSCQCFSTHVCYMHAHVVYRW